MASARWSALPCLPSPLLPSPVEQRGEALDGRQTFGENERRLEAVGAAGPPQRIARREQAKHTVNRAGRRVGAATVAELDRDGPVGAVGRAVRMLRRRRRDRLRLLIDAVEIGVLLERGEGELLDLVKPGRGGEHRFRRRRAVDGRYRGR